MSGDSLDFSPVDHGFVRIEKQPDGMHRVTVLRTPDGPGEAGVVSVQLRCHRVDVDGGVHMVDAGGGVSRSLAPVVVHQSYRTGAVRISASPGG